MHFLFFHQIIDPNTALEFVAQWIGAIVDDLSIVLFVHFIKRNVILTTLRIFLLSDLIPIILLKSPVSDLKILLFMSYLKKVSKNC